MDKSVFGQEEETCNTVAAHCYFGHLIFEYAASTTPVLSTSSWLAAWPVIGIWMTAMEVSTMAFNLNGFSFSQLVLDSDGRAINTWADIGMKVTRHECNAHNFPLDLAFGEV
ncbi:protein D1 [Seminavis robusta]|uniref:Protein D1 n=1 Tax=Seminavis robusta TaxID=568900 RepID=A0A9N8EEN5_9STRA|nr:protein D1 [Seminavis robusta]|eukprot:Sro982_g227720.1 protein D1 (112) ;mRNA; f:26791-27203